MIGLILSKPVTRHCCDCDEKTECVFTVINGRRRWLCPSCRNKAEKKEAKRIKLETGEIIKEDIRRDNSYYDPCC